MIEYQQSNISGMQLTEIYYNGELAPEPIMEYQQKLPETVRNLISVVRWKT